MNQSLTPEMKKRVDEMLGQAYEKVLQSIKDKDASQPLTWLKDLPTDLVRAAIVDTMPYGWGPVSVQYVESQNDEQAAMMLGCIVATFVTADCAARAQMGAKK